MRLDAKILLKKIRGNGDAVSYVVRVLRVVSGEEGGEGRVLGVDGGDQSRADGEARLLVGKLEAGQCNIITYHVCMFGMWTRRKGFTLWISGSSSPV